MHKIIPTNAIVIPEAADCKFRGIVFDVYQWPQQLFDGTSETFEMLKRPDTVVVIAIKENTLFFQRESQPHHETRFGLPGGRVEASDASWLAAAQRECQEETGATFSSWRLVDVEQPYSKIEWFVATYVAWDLQEIHSPVFDVGECITPQLLELAEAKKTCAKDPDLIRTHNLLSKVDTIDELKALPAFVGKEVNR